MKTIFTFLLAVFFTCGTYAQSYSVTQVTYNHSSLTSPTIAAVLEDQYSGVIPIGFSFCFYGGTYTSLLIGSNGVLSFDTSMANVYCQWPIGTAIPNGGASPMNAILFPWQDLYAVAGGTMSYQTIGSSPNRRFIVEFDSVPLYSCSATLFTGQVKLSETTNEIEIEITQKQLCPGWNGGKAIEGLNNITGTASTVVPGKNSPNQWTATNESWLFTPTSNVCNGVGISESQNPEISLFVSDQNQITILPNGQNYKLLSVYNTLGQEMKFTKSENTISLLETNPGIYIVNLEVNGVRVTKKVMLN